eukprot:CAMPEP_0172668880 /NCGR_PEP_ID=MMETSP1074-20121228/9331_1 /TAXON_ID=2916 /ORGANISM="Ceratium fusus, Strain PA161109" /LENGTH=117 /DNA_ID=CAMNT_0013485583 /DNA_START=142 /DNA_END=495 /DNA_ORIENTATION=+
MAPAFLVSPSTFGFAAGTMHVLNEDTLIILQMLSDPTPDTCTSVPHKQDFITTNYADFAPGASGPKLLLPYGCRGPSTLSKAKLASYPTASLQNSKLLIVFIVSEIPHMSCTTSIHT